jgi:hypothetical protein
VAPSCRSSHPGQSAGTTLSPEKCTTKSDGVTNGKQRTDWRQPARWSRKKAARSLKGKLMGKTAWTKRDGKFMAVKRSKKKFKGVLREKRAA